MQPVRTYTKIYNTENRVTGLRGDAARSKYNEGRPPLFGARDSNLIQAAGRMNLGRRWIEFGRRGQPAARHTRSSDAGVFEGDSSEITLSTILGGSYEYAVPYTRVYEENGEVYYDEGIVGVPTDARDMPVSGGAIYRGSSAARVAHQGETWQLADGRSWARVDFATGKMRVTLSHLKVQEGSSSASAPMDLIIMPDVQVNGAQFSGSGGAIMRKDGSGVRFVGEGSTSVVQGRFYGFDAENRMPDELGGQILVQGPDGGVVGTFIAD